MIIYSNQEQNMKFIIVGKHASGKHEALEVCVQQGIAVGREFSNIPEALPQIYIDENYIRYSQEDINNIFEQGSYISIGGIEESGVIDSYMYYRGVSHYEFDASDVIVLTPSQLENINTKIIKDHIVFVWLDNTLDNRIRRHAEEGRKYSFSEQEEIENSHGLDFVKTLYNFPNSDVLYFSNEEPERVGTIIASLVKHNDLIDNFIKNFN